MHTPEAWCTLGGGGKKIDLRDNFNYENSVAEVDVAYIKLEITHFASLQRWMTAAACPLSTLLLPLTLLEFSC